VYRRVAIALCLVAGCTAATPPYRGIGPEPKTAADREVVRAVELYLDLSAQIDPLRAARSGRHRWIERWPDRSPDGANELARVAEQALVQIAAIDPELLSAAQRVDLEILYRSSSYDIALVARIREQGRELDFLVEEIVTGLDGLLASDSGLDERRRLEALLTRLERLEQQISLLEPALERAAPPVATRAIERLAGRKIDRELPALARAHPELTDRFDSVWPAAARALAELTSEIYARTRREVRDFRVGREAFSRELGARTGSTAEELHAAALRAIATPNLDPIALPSIDELRKIERESPRVTLIRRARPFEPLLDAFEMLAAEPSARAIHLAAAVADIEAHTSTAAPSNLSLERWQSVSDAVLARITELSGASGDRAGAALSEIQREPGRAAARFAAYVALRDLLSDARGRAIEPRELAQVLFAYGVIPPDLARILLHEDGLL
jgi:hypothetical protein